MSDAIVGAGSTLPRVRRLRRHGYHGTSSTGTRSRQKWNRRLLSVASVWTSLLKAYYGQQLVCGHDGIWDERIDPACCPYPEHDPRDHNWCACLECFDTLAALHTLRCQFLKASGMQIAEAVQCTCMLATVTNGKPSSI
eukprot:5758351-Pleurochrysis_carterae.AAC.6